MWASDLDSLSCSYVVQMHDRKHFFTCAVSFMSARVPQLPVTLSAQLPGACHQSCHSLTPFPYRAFSLASSPYSPFHGSRTSCILHALFCVCMCVCMNDEEQRQWSVTRAPDILSASHLLGSTWSDVNGIQVNTPGTLRRHMHTHTHTLYYQAFSNASLKAPELRGKPLRCLLYWVVKCWQLHIMVTNWCAEFDASPGVVDGCLKTLWGLSR